MYNITSCKIIKSFFRHCAYNSAVVAFGAQVAEQQEAGVLREDGAERLHRLLVAEVAVPVHDPALEPKRTIRFRKHFQIVIRFQKKRIRSRQFLFDGFREVPEIRHNRNLVPTVIPQSGNGVPAVKTIRCEPIRFRLCSDRQTVAVA